MAGDNVLVLKGVRLTFPTHLAHLAGMASFVHSLKGGGEGCTYHMQRIEDMQWHARAQRLGHDFTRTHDCTAREHAKILSLQLVLTLGWTCL